MTDIKPSEFDIVTARLKMHNTRMDESMRGKGYTSVMHMAKNCDIHYITLLKLYGLRSNGRPETRKRLADFLGVSVDYLFPSELINAVDHKVFEQAQEKKIFIDGDRVQLISSLPQAMLLTDGGIAECIDSVHNDELKETLEDLITKTCTNHEAYVLKHFYGIGCEEIPIMELAKEFEVSKQQIYNILKKAQRNIQRNVKGVKNLREYVPIDEQEKEQKRRNEIREQLSRRMDLIEFGIRGEQI